MPNADMTKLFTANQKYRALTLSVPAEHTIENLKEPSYWTHLAGAGRIGPLDFIDCVWEDMSKAVLVRVLTMTRTSACVKIWDEKNLTEDMTNASGLAEIGNYDVSFSGPEKKFRIVRKSDRQFVRDGFDTHEAAVRFLVTEYLGSTRVSPSAPAQKPDTKKAA